MTPLVLGAVVLLTLNVHGHGDGDGEVGGDGETWVGTYTESTDAQALGERRGAGDDGGGTVIGGVQCGDLNISSSVLMTPECDGSDYLLCGNSDGEPQYIQSTLEWDEVDTSWSYLGQYCGPLPEAGPVITPALVQQEFARMPLPASNIVVEPPGGVTLVNLETNFYTDAESFSQTFTLLGQQVEISTWPSSFAWNHGDGTTATTTTPGAPYPSLDVTHAYAQTGTYAVSVDTTWSAQYRVNGGAWLAVPDTLTIGGAAVSVEAREAVPVLTG